jgi:dihydropteroate synthase
LLRNYKEYFILKMVQSKSFNINIKGNLFDLGVPRVMGILNVTPDSFFSSSRYMSEDGILRRVEEIIDDGADILDVGACSTRPGIELVSEEEELLRLRMALHLIRKRWPGIIISVDTFRSNVARIVVREFGADMINDISGGDMDEGMFKAISDLKVPYILMHMKGTPVTMQINPEYDDLLRDICMYFSERVHKLRSLGVNDIILDPGYGFGKTIEHNFELLRRLSEFDIFELPVLVGISRKSMIYKLLNITPEQSLNGTTVLNTLALQNGANILRVHDVKEARECVQLVQTYKTFGLCQ